MCHNVFTAWTSEVALHRVYSNLDAFSLDEINFLKL